MSEVASDAFGEVEAGLQERFSNLEIQGLIARGGMGVVYRAIQIQLDRPVALKILPDEFVEDELRRTLFVREARAMAKLSHPHLVQLFDFGENDGLWFMVQELVPGKTLFDHQQEGLLEINDGVRLVREVLAGLQHAHENGVVHRDIKPANIIIDREGSVKLTDFGLAQSVGGDHAEEEEEDAFGTPEYAAPELYVDGATIDHRADIFAVGVLLFELLTGQQPSTTYQAPSEMIEDLGTRFDDIISRAMQNDPENRYHSCAEFDSDLYNALTGEEAEASSPNKKILTGPVTATSLHPSLTNTGLTSLASAQSNTGGQTLSVLVGVGLVIGGFAYFFGGDPEDPEENSKTIAVEDPVKSSQPLPLPSPKIRETKSVEVKPTPVVEEPKIVKKRKKEPLGPIQELIDIEEGVLRKSPALIAAYDTEMKVLRGTYLGACRKSARKGNAVMAKFWAAEATTFKEKGSPPELDDGIPDFALKLRNGWRKRQQLAVQPLKLLHIDTIERLDLLVKEFQRGSHIRKSSKVSERAIALQTFDSFIDFCREKKIGQK